jgi:hypothetical protein
MDSKTTPLTSARQRVWVSTAEACEVLGMSRETLRQLRLRGVLQPGKHDRCWGAPRDGDRCNGTSRTWRPPSPVGAGGISGAEPLKLDVKSCIYNRPTSAELAPLAQSQPSNQSVDAGRHFQQAIRRWGNSLAVRLPADCLLEVPACRRVIRSRSS